MKNQIEQYMEAALAAVEAHLLKDADRKIVWEEYDGYAASLGPSIRMSGLIPALAFYTDVSRKGGDRKRHKVLMAIYDILHPDAEGATAPRSLLDTVLAEVYTGNLSASDTLLTPSRMDADQLSAWKTRVRDASVALKLALRTFIHSDQKLEPNEP